MQHYHVITNEHNYGASDTLLGAMRNAQVHIGMFAACCMSLEFDDLEDLKYNVDTPESFEHGEGDTIECVISVTKTDKWEYAGSSHVDGSASYKWLLDDEDIPDEVEMVNYKVRVHLDTGVIENLTDDRG